MYKVYDVAWHLFRKIWELTDSCFFEVYNAVLMTSSCILPNRGTRPSAVAIRLQYGREATETDRLSITWNPASHELHSETPSYCWRQTHGITELREPSMPSWQKHAVAMTPHIENFELIIKFMGSPKVC